jgi:hypothetical protein
VHQATTYAGAGVALNGAQLAFAWLVQDPSKSSFYILHGLCMQAAMQPFWLMRVSRFLIGVDYMTVA